MGILPSDERVHRSTLCTQQAQPRRRVEPSTSDIDGSITGPLQHGNNLKDIFVDKYGIRLDGECGEQAMSKVYFRVPSTGGVRGGHFCSTSAQDIARFLQPSVASDSQSPGLSGGCDEVRGSSRGSIRSIETKVAQVPFFGATHDHNLSGNLLSSRRSNSQGTTAYDLPVALQDYLRLGGTSAEEIEPHMKALGDETFKRYNRAWIKLLPLASSKPSFTSIRDLDTTPISSLAYWLIQFSEKESLAEARCAYAALLLFSGAHALRFEPILKGIKKQWNYSVPRYVVCYDVPKLLQQLPYLGARTESQVLLRLILVLRFFALFLGIDLERTKRTDIIKQGKVWFVQARRKGRPVYEPRPIHTMSNGAYCPIYLVGVYLEMTSSYEGNEIFVSLKAPRKPIVAGTINSLTTKFLRSMGLHEFTAHSTRGSAATPLIMLGVDPHIVCELGDWRNYDTFRRFYNRVRAMTNIAQSLVPEDSDDSELLLME